VLDGVYRSDAAGVPEFIEVAASTEAGLHELLQTVIARLMKRLTRRGVLLEDDGQSTLAESDTDAEEARPLRPLQAGAVTHRFRPARRTQGADPERGDAARGRSAPAAVRRRRRVQPACCGPSRSTRSQAAGAVDGLALQRCSRGGGCAPCPASGPSTGSRPGSRPAAACSLAAFTPGCVQGASRVRPGCIRKRAFAPCSPLPMALAAPAASLVRASEIPAREETCVALARTGSGLNYVGALGLAAQVLSVPHEGGLGL
jgi:hypothetical protein